MKISIITAGYSAKYLDGVWGSIKKQTYKKWEWILVIDSSESVVAWHNQQLLNGVFDGYDVWVIILKKNQGRYGLVSRNIGVMASGYERIVFLDDDNEFEEEDYLETLVGVEKKTHKIPYTKLHLLGKKPKSTYDRYKETSLGRHHIDLGNPFYRKRFFLDYGYFDDRKNRIMFDFDFIEKIIEREGEDAFIKVNKHLLFRHKRY